MNAFFRVPYAAAGALTRVATALAPAGESKLAAALHDRRGLLQRYRAWSSAHRDRGRRLLWVHAPSVGEGLQAAPIIQRLRRHRPDLQIVYTFFSPSAKRFARTLDVDFADYLPFDTIADVTASLDALAPSALVFSKLDVWPLLTEIASARGVKLGLLSATVAAQSRRRAGLVRMALRDAYAALDAVGAIAQPDADRLVEMGVRAERVSVTGDTRYDQVLEKVRAPGPRRHEVLGRVGEKRPTVVAGSTWPSDERHLLRAWLEVKRSVPYARLIIAAHEISPERLGGLEQWADDSSLTLTRTRGSSTLSTDVVLVDEYGLLGDLYAAADIAYVGGGFQRAGLHSLLEPAAFGVPVLIGPMHSDNRDATLLTAAGGAIRCADAEQLAVVMTRWLNSESERLAAGVAARTVVESERGAADRSVAIVEGLLA